MMFEYFRTGFRGGNSFKISKPFPYDVPFAKHFSSTLSSVYMLISKVVFESGCLPSCSLFPLPS